MTAFTLKVLALAIMVIDHVGYAFAGQIDTSLLRAIGRISFPIYVFLISEGCRHTKDMKKYMFRLALFAVVSEIPFDLFIRRKYFDMRSQNIFFTLLLGAAAVYLYRLLRERGFPVALLSCIPFIALAQFLKTDYGGFGVAAICLCYVLKDKKYQAVALFGLFALRYNYNPAFCAAVLAVLPVIILYNGRRGYPLKYIFYIIYPAHLLLLTGLRYLAEAQ